MKLSFIFNLSRLLYLSLLILLFSHHFYDSHAFHIWSTSKQFIKRSRFTSLRNDRVCNTLKLKNREMNESLSNVNIYSNLNYRNRLNTNDINQSFIKIIDDIMKKGIEYRRKGKNISRMDSNIMNMKEMEISFIQLTKSILKVSQSNIEQLEFKIPTSDDVDISLSTNNNSKNITYTFNKNQCPKCKSIVTEEKVRMFGSCIFCRQDDLRMNINIQNSQDLTSTVSMKPISTRSLSIDSNSFQKPYSKIKNTKSLGYNRISSPTTIQQPVLSQNQLTLQNKIHLSRTNHQTNDKNMIYENTDSNNSNSNMVNYKENHRVKELENRVIELENEMDSLKSQLEMLVNTNNSIKGMISKLWEHDESIDLIKKSKLFKDSV